MAKYFYTAFLLSLSIFSFGQNLSLDQAIAARGKSLSSLEEYLTARNWQLTEAREGTDSTRSSIHFAFNKNIYDDTAEAFISAYYSRDLYASNRLRIQINRRLTYNAYMLRLKALGFILFSSRIEDKTIIKIYKNRKYVIQVEASPIVNDNSVTKTMYMFLLSNRIDYENNLE